MHPRSPARSPRLTTHSPRSTTCLASLWRSSFLRPLRWGLRVSGRARWRARALAPRLCPRAGLLASYLGRCQPSSLLHHAFHKSVLTLVAAPGRSSRVGRVDGVQHIVEVRHQLRLIRGCGRAPVLRPLCVIKQVGARGPAALEWRGCRELSSAHPHVNLSVRVRVRVSRNLLEGGPVETGPQILETVSAFIPLAHGLRGPGLPGIDIWIGILLLRGGLALLVTLPKPTSPLEELTQSPVAVSAGELKGDARAVSLILFILPLRGK